MFFGKLCFDTELPYFMKFRVFHFDTKLPSRNRDSVFGGSKIDRYGGSNIKIWSISWGLRENFSPLASISSFSSHYWLWKGRRKYFLLLYHRHSQGVSLPSGAALPYKGYRIGSLLVLPLTTLTGRGGSNREVTLTPYSPLLERGGG